MWDTCLQCDYLGWTANLAPSVPHTPATNSVADVPTGKLDLVVIAHGVVDVRLVELFSRGEYVVNARS